MESFSLKLDASRLATINECNKNSVLQKQLDISMKEKSAVERELNGMVELKKDNISLKVIFLLHFERLFRACSVTVGDLGYHFKGYVLHHW